MIAFKVSYRENWDYIVVTRTTQSKLITFLWKETSNEYVKSVHKLANKRTSMRSFVEFLN